jgi:hypothetical protein
MDRWSYDIAPLVSERPEDPNEVVRVLETAHTRIGVRLKRVLWTRAENTGCLTEEEASEGDKVQPRQNSG